MSYRVDIGLDAPPSRQLAEQVLGAIARGELAPGDRLPSIRGLAAEALVNPNTVGKVYRELEALGAVAARNGAGVFVAAAGPGIARERLRRRSLERLRAAAAEALAAGHGPADLARALAPFLDPVLRMEPAAGEGGGR